MGELDEKWNRDRCHEFRRALDDTSELDVGILHHNCMNMKGEGYEKADLQFNFFRRLKWHWLQGNCSVKVSTEH